MKRFLTAVLAMCIFCTSLCGFFAHAQNVITTPEQFISISDAPLADYVLGSDIDLSDYDFDSTLFERFGGSLDGAGYAVTGITINSQSPRTALFDTVSGNISNIRFEGSIEVISDFSGGICVSALACTSDGGKITRVTTNVDIIASAPEISVGAICAISKNSTVISDCKNLGDITFLSRGTGGFVYAGGITAYINDKTVQVSDCENGGNITVGDKNCTNTLASGIVAFCNSQTTISGNLNSGNITAVSGTDAYSGGICAIAANYTMLKQNENRGSITASADCAYAGGISGEVSGRDGGGSIYNCANFGSVTADSAAGGLAGNFNGRVLSNNFVSPEPQITAAQNGRLCGLTLYTTQNRNNYIDFSDSYPALDFEKVWTLSDGAPHIVGAGTTLAPMPAPKDYYEWSYDSGSGALTITGTGKMPDFEKNGAPWDNIRSKIYSVVVDEGITEIGNWSFAYLYYVRSVDLPQTLERIGTNAFYQCSKLEEAIIPESVNTIQSGAFAYCKTLQSISIPSNITKIGNSAFFDCNKLKKIYFNSDKSAWDEISKGTGNQPLVNAEVLTNTLAGTTWSFDETTGTLTIGGNARMVNYDAKTAPWYQHYASIKKVVVEEGVTGIGNWAFSYCSGLTDVVLPDSLVHIGSGAFYNCFKLKNINLPAGLRRIFSGAFYNCKVLESITIPVGVTTIYANTFLSCPKLANVSYNGTKVQWQKVEILKNNTALTNLEVNCLVKSIEWTLSEDGTLTISGGVAMDDYELNKDPKAPWSDVKTQVKKVVIENGIPNIGKNAFYGCNNLTEIEIPESVTRVGYGAFFNCFKLKSVTIPNNVTYIGSGAFYNNSALESITIPASVTSILQNTFYGCKNLKTVTYGGDIANLTVNAKGNDFFTNAIN